MVFLIGLTETPVVLLVRPPVLKPIPEQLVAPFDIQVSNELSPDAILVGVAVRSTVTPDPGFITVTVFWSDAEPFTPVHKSVKVVVADSAPVDS